MVALEHILIIGIHQIIITLQWLIEVIEIIDIMIVTHLIDEEADPEAQTEVEIDHHLRGGDVVIVIIIDTETMTTLRVVTLETLAVIGIITDPGNAHEVVTSMRKITPLDHLQIDIIIITTMAGEVLLRVEDRLHRPPYNRLYMVLILPRRFGLTEGQPPGDISMILHT